MKFSCEKALLQGALTSASRAVSSKSSIPALEGIHLCAMNGILRITGYDLTTGVRSFIAADVVEEGELVMDARLFGDIIRRMPDDMISIKTENFMVNIRCGISDFNIMGIDPDEYPDLPSVEYEHTCTIEQGVLKSMISQTIFAVSTNESRPIHTGIMFECSKENDTLTLVAVDGYRLALRKEKVQEVNGKGDFSFVCPAPALNQVINLCGDSEEAATIVLGSKHVMFKVGDTMLVARKLTGEFLDYKKSIPAEYKIRVETEKKRFQSSIERVSLVITEKQKSPIRCLFENDNLKIRVKTPIGSAYDECLISGDGQNMEIGFNNKYMMDALKAAPADTIRMNMNGSISPCIITPADDKDNFLYMVLPVRIQPGN